VVIAVTKAYSKAWSINPPKHPMFPWSNEQSTNYYSDKDGKSTFPNKNYALSIDPVAENAQQDPHYPWSLTGVTAFLVLQSTSSNIS